MGNAGSSRPKFAPYIVGTAIAASFGVASVANAALEEVIVTAQKREQSVQEVPIAITAMTQAALETNRVTSVTDLSGLAPNLTARPAAGGVSVASFSMRGVTSYGVVPGSDKEISIYLDGVYVGSPRGSIFNLPDVAQLEVLRGPQGTLFGRNATAGAINITTHDPAGEFGLRQDLSYGNHAYYRQRTSIDSPQWGPFSFAGTYAKEKRRGDIENVGAGTTWNRTAFGQGIDVSPKHLGDKDAENYFLAARFQPTDSFTMTFKADKTTDHGTPDAIAPVAVGNFGFVPGLGLVATGGSYPNNLGAAGANAIYGSQANKPPLTTNGKRPDTVNNAFTTPLSQLVWGESLTTVFDVNDQVSIKNITAYRKTQVTVATDLTGLGGMVVPVAPGVSFPFCLVCTQNDSDSDQWSSELQVNYESDLLTLTVGALYYEGEDRSGGPKGSFNTVQFAFLPGYVIPSGGTAGAESLSYNSAQSTAAYTQIEFHLTDTVDLVAGLRETRDRKSGEYHKGASAGSAAIAPNPFFGFPGQAAVGPSPASISSFSYEKSRPSYMLGVNYKPTFDTLIYAKLSEAFVSGGSVGGVPFEPEIAKSWEAGVKSDFLDSKLRSNLSVFYTDYRNVQASSSGQNVGHPELGTLIVTQGSETAKGAEWEGSASVGYGITLNASLGYTHIRFGDVNPVLLSSVGADNNPMAFPNSSFVPSLIPEWTGNLGAQYESEPLFEQSYLSFNVAGNWHDGMRLDQNPARPANSPGFEQVDHSPASWVINSRLALKKINLGLAGGEGEIALWGRNLNDNKYPNYALNFGGLAVGANYLPARSYGVDLSVKF